MSNFASSSPVILKGLRAAWLDIFKPGEGMNGGAPKFKFTGLMEPDSEALKIGKAAMLEAATKLWGPANAANMIRSMAANSRAIRDGNDKMSDDGTVRPEYENMFFISASNKADKKPQVAGIFTELKVPAQPGLSARVDIDTRFISSPTGLKLAVMALGVLCVAASIVALAVLGIGLALMPFLPRLMKGGEGVENLQLIYLLYLLQAVTSYLLSYKNAIYQAYQKAYIRKAVDQVIGIVRVILQIVVLVTTRNFILYLIIQLFMPMLTSVIIWARADREFPYLKQYKELPEPQERKAIFKNVGALSLHKLATVIVRSTDNLIMSAFDGLATVGIYSNYKLVLMNVNNLLGHVTGAFTASIGNLNALEGRKRVYEIFRILDFAAFLLYGYLSGGLVTLINFFIRMIFGEEYLFSMTVVVIIMAEFFISGLRQMGLQFREALGLFWHDRYKALAEAIINLVVSLILVRRFGVAGIIGGTIISSLLTCVWFEPYVLMRYGIEEDWQKKLRRYFMDYIVRWVVVAGVSAVSYWIFQLMPQTNFLWFIAQGLIYTAIFAAVVLTVYGRTPEFQYLLEMTVRKLRKKLHSGA